MKDSYGEKWPSLPYVEWKETYATLHRWTQIIGKIRLAKTPWVNHSWHVTLYVTSRGLTTTPIPYGERSLQIDFDFVRHKLVIEPSDDEIREIDLRAKSVAYFYNEVFAALHDLGFEIKISPIPNEVEDATPLNSDQRHTSYEPDYANRFWRILIQVDQVFKKFRAEFIGKCSPVHFFWGSFDLAVTRFSGRAAPPHPGGIPHLPDWVAREAYSHEVSSAGFWPGGDSVPLPLFYSYAYPEPPGFSGAVVKPPGAYYSSELREFVMPYDVARESESPENTLLDFLKTTYEAAATLASWDRGALQRTVAGKYSD